MTLFIASLAVGALWPLLEYVIPWLLPQYSEAVPLIQMLLIAVITRNMSPFTSIILISPLVDKQGVLGPTQLVCTGLLFAACHVLDITNMMSLEGIVLANVLGYTLYNISLLWYYYQYFWKTYVRVDQVAI